MYLTQCLHRSVQINPSATATIYGDRVRTFAEQADRVARLGGALRGLGVRDGERVGILSLNSDRFVEAMYGVWWAGGAINPINWRWSAAEIVFSLQESQTDILFVDDKFAAFVPALREGYPGLRTVVHMGDGGPPPGMLSFEDLVNLSQPVEDVRRGGDQLGILLYTGGTTGHPKAAMLSHAGVLTSVYGSEVTIQSVRDKSTLIAVPLFHASGFGRWLPHAVRGNTTVILPTFEPTAVMQAIEKHQVQDVPLVPTMLQMVVDHPEISNHDMSCVQTLVYGAAPITTSLLQRAMHVFHNASFTQIYGMTELSPIATVLTHEHHSHGNRINSAGHAAGHAEVRIVDANDNEVPRGTIGEIVCRGSHVMLGYWNRPEETEQALRGGWMHTGDGGYMDQDGFVYIVDRVKDMIISGGENVYSTEVENALARHPAIASCAVIGVPDDTWGERVHAVIVLRPGQTVTAEEIRDFCKQWIAGYKSPRSCEFVEALPLSPAGKVLKRVLREPYWKGATRQVN